MALLSAIPSWLDDSKNPGTVSVWWAALLFLLVVLAIWRLWLAPVIRRLRDKRKHRRAVTARRQKEREAWWE